MLRALQNIELNDLTRLLKEPNDSWNTMDVDYHPPRVERVWKQVNPSCRVLLHRIHRCNEDETLWHAHPWPSAVSVVSGMYEHRVGYMIGGYEAPSASNIVTLCRTVLRWGSYYEMTQPQAWHCVRPISLSCLTIMVTGLPYAKDLVQPSLVTPSERQGPLSDKARDEILDEFRRRSCDL